MQFGVVVFNRRPLSNAQNMARWARRAEALGYDFPAHDPPGSRSSVASAIAVTPLAGYQFTIPLHQRNGATLLRKTCGGHTTMAEDSLTLDEVRRKAAEIGMTRFTDEHLQQLLRATKTARARREALPVGKITPADEPAHVFRLGAEGER